MNAKNISYFPGLHALRFFAATMVIFHHIEQYKSWAGISNSWGNSVIDALGHQPVSFFFVLSGFLITYLLLKENHQKQQIKLGQFYWRRILRIWPLYYVIVAIALFIVPAIVGDTFLNFENPQHSMLVIVCLVFFLPNLLRIGFPDLVGANQLWSVGIEEQFYLFWPLLIRRFVKNIIPFLLLFVAAKFLIHTLLVQSMGWSSSVRLHQIAQLYALFPVEQMAIGGLGAALLFHQKTKWVRFFSHPLMGILAVAMIALSAYLGWHHWMLTYVHAVVFTSIIFQIIHHKSIHSKLESSLFTHLGNISYGIYMWHTLAITLVMSTFKALGVAGSTSGNIILYSSTVALTLILAHFSYQYLEKPFLKLKGKNPLSLIAKIKLRRQTSV